jgi:hypothetical protein
MERGEMTDSLEFRVDLAADDDIREIAGVDLDIVAASRLVGLPAESFADLGELVTEAPMINGFEQPRSRASMNAHGKANDSIREVFTIGGLCIHVDNQAGVAAGLGEITDGRLMD